MALDCSHVAAVDCQPTPKVYVQCVRIWKGGSIRSGAPLDIN